MIGKGILRFRVGYWPAFLASAGQCLPTSIPIHPYLTVGGAKLAKSTGDVADTTAIVEAYGSDRLRWWFGREVGAVADTDFSPARLVARADEDLAHGLGNLVNRIVSPVHRSRGGEVPLSEIETESRTSALASGTKLVLDAETNPEP